MMNTWRFIAATLICVVFVGMELEPWIFGAGMIFILWKAAIEHWHLAKPSRWLTNTLTVLSLAIILVKYRTLMSQDASSGFLVLLTSLKLLEERTLRDQKFLFLLGFVLISSLMLFSLELPALVGSLVSFYLLWTAQNKTIKYRNVFLKAAPVALLLFLFFPRVQNPFGLQGMNGGIAGQTGFSDELNPGSIAKIQSTKELVFRVQFLNRQLKPRTLEQYWRGQVLSFSEGLRWTLAPRPQRDLRAERLQTADYEVTLEPHNKRWVFVFDPTDNIHSNEIGFFLKNNAYFESVAPLRERVVYQGQIAKQNKTTDLEKINLQAPAVSSALKDFAQNLKQKATSRDQLAEMILNYYRARKFTYSKSPGTGSSTLDDFFFKSKKGYCEHYAATTATLLRLAGVPARVVTGYQGGEYNSYGNFWKFTQADAHAWVEYQDDQNTWQRMDPTSVVAPERLELGGLLFEELPEEWVGQNRALEFLKSRDAWWIRAKDMITLSFESFNYDLVVFLLDFNIEKQKELLQQYGAWVVVFALTLLSPFLLLSIFRRRKPDLGDWIVKELDKKAAQQKLHRKTSETLRQFIERWSQKNPSDKQNLEEILKAYEATEYQSKTQPIRRQQIKTLLKNLAR